MSSSNRPGSNYLYAGDVVRLHSLSRKFKETWTENTVRYRQVVGGKGLKKSLHTCMQFDLGWMMTEAPWLFESPISIVHSFPTGVPDAETQAKFPCPIKFYQPPCPAFGVHHAKTAFLLYPSCLRVAVSTANILSVDYASRTNATWMQEFPRLTGDNKTQTSQGIEFEAVLYDYLVRVKEQEWADLLGEFNFDGVKVALVTSVPGRHSGAELNRYGHMRVRSILSGTVIDEKFHTNPGLFAAFSSFGSLNVKLLDEISQSFFTSAGHTNEKGAIHLVWPTLDFVRNAANGYHDGGSLCLSTKNVKSWLGQFLYRWKPWHSSRARCTPHIKSYARFIQGSQDQDLAWALFTSANCSGAAWGVLNAAKTSVFIRHYEMGVMLLPSLMGRLTAGQVPGVASSHVVVPIPMDLRTIADQKYQASDEPWTNSTHEEPDLFGHTYPPQSHRRH